MKLNHGEIVELAREHGKSLSAILRAAGVSRTAYYSLVRRPNILPRTVRALAEVLEVPQGDLLEESEFETFDDPRLRKAREICAKYPEVDFHNVWHTLTLLERSPLERLRGSLLRGGA